jgi:hypothetical protein
MRAGFILLLLIAPLFNASAVTQEPDLVGASVKTLLTRMQAAHQPVKECVSAKREALGDNFIANELATSDAMADLEEVVTLMLESDNPYRQRADTPGLSGAKRAFLILQGLDSYGLEYSSPNDRFAVYRAQRHVLGDMLRAKLPSVGCVFPENLAGLMREARDLDVYVNLATAYAPLMDCTAEWLESGGPMHQVLARIVEKGLAIGFSDLVISYLGENHPAVVSARQEKIEEVERTRRLLEGLAIFSVSSTVDQPFSQWNRRLLAKIETRRLISQTMDLDCTSSDNLLTWMKFAKDEYL